MKKRLLILLSLGLFVLSACSVGPSTTINITMTDFMFTPDSFTVPAGKEITVLDF